jgi:hypothetical protein
MAFEPQPTVNRVPSEISTLEITLLDTTEEDDPRGPKAALYRITVEDQYGQPMNHYNGDLVPHLTSAQVQGLLDFMDDLRSQAESEILP